MDELIFNFEHRFGERLYGFCIFNIYKRLSIMGITCYSIHINIPNGCGKQDEYINNICCMPSTIYAFIQKIKINESHLDSTNVPIILTRIKKQIMDKLKEDESFQQLSKLNIVDELHKNKQEIIEMKSFIQQMQEDMKHLVATTSKIQQENTLLTNLLEQEKEKTKKLTIQESQGLSFTHANAIGQALMCESDIFNCM